MDAASIYRDEWAGYAYSAQPPLKPVCLQLTHVLLQAYHLLSNDHCRMIPAVEVGVLELSRFHAAEYLKILQAVSEGQVVPQSARYGLGLGDNPIFPGMFRFAALIAGASLQAAQVVDAGERASPLTSEVVCITVCPPAPPAFATSMMWYWPSIT